MLLLWGFKRALPLHTISRWLVHLGSVLLKCHFSLKKQKSVSYEISFGFLPLLINTQLLFI